MDIVGYVRFPRWEEALDHRMAAIDDIEDRGIVDFGTDVPVLHRHGSKRTETIECGEDACVVLNGLRVLGNAESEALEEFCLECEDPFFRVENLLLELLQLGSDKSLGIGEGLFADVVLRRLFPVRVGDLDVIPEHVVETHLEGGNPRPLPLGLLEGGDPLLAAQRKRADLVKFRAVPGADDSPVGKGGGGIGLEGALEKRHDLGERMKPLPGLPEQAGGGGGNDALQTRCCNENGLESRHVPGGRASRANPCVEPFQVADPGQNVGASFPQPRIGNQLLNGVETGTDWRDGIERCVHPLFEQPPSHGS